MNGYYFYLCVNYSPSIILNDELIHIRLNLNDGAASKIGQYEQFHFADFVKIARLLLTEKKNNTFLSACTVYNQSGVLRRKVTKRIFLKYKPIFYIKNIIYTEVPWRSNLFCEICKNLFRQGAILQFQYHLFNFLPIFQNKFFDNCKCHIYIICSKNWSKINPILFVTDEPSNFAEIIFFNFFRTSNNIKDNVFQGNIAMNSLGSIYVK